MLIRQFHIKGKPAEMFDFIKCLYMKKLQEEAGYNLNIPNNKIIERLIEEKYKQLTEQ